MSYRAHKLLGRYLGKWPLMVPPQKKYILKALSSHIGHIMKNKQNTSVFFLVRDKLRIRPRRRRRWRRRRKMLNTTSIPILSGILKVSPPQMSGNPREGGVAMVVSAFGELKEIRECCNLQAHIVFFMRDMRFNCVVKFSDGYRGWEGCVCFLWIGVRIFGEIWASLTILPSGESSSKRYLISYHFRTCFWKRTAQALLWCIT